MMSSRVFVKGLPPSLSENDFRQHFSAKFEVTDAKLISNRRIGYVGCKSPEDAEKVVKYFNRSFIRMSKIGVEIARPISSSPGQISRGLNTQATDSTGLTEGTNGSHTSKPSTVKRKWETVDDSNPRVQEFLEVMQPKGKTRAFSLEIDRPIDDEPHAKRQALEPPDGASDDEYEDVPRKTNKTTAPPIVAGSDGVASEIPPSSAVEKTLPEVPKAIEPSSNQMGTDEDWLRLRTNRLLDLVDPVDMPLASTSNPSNHSHSMLAPDIRIPIDSTSENYTYESTTNQELQPQAFSGPNDHSDHVDPAIEAIRANGRLFVRNLPYSASESDLRQHFKSFGALKETHLPVNAAGVSKGFALIQYEDPDSALEAFHGIDREPFQGRLLHVIPAASRKEQIFDEHALAKLPLKKQKQIQRKAQGSTITFNWNSLYMSQDAVNSSVAQKLNISKSELLDPTSADAGVKQAIAETAIIQDTKSYFAKNGVDLDAFKKGEKGDTSILVKNFPYGMSAAELRTMFEQYGQVLRVLMPPAGTIAIVEFAQSAKARIAFSSMAYRRVKGSVLFLEKAPKDLFIGTGNSEDVILKTNPQVLSVDLLGHDASQKDDDASTLYVRNLNFTTTSDRLAEVFRSCDGFLSARIKTKTDPKKPGQVLSMGFGFVEFRTKVQAHAALTAKDGWSLDGHSLIIRASHRGLDAGDVRKAGDKSKKLAGKRTKIIIKNLPFEASKKDVRALFGNYGQLRTVRMPKKMDNSTRGFAFADFITAREAENALEALRNTHLLGRRLVLDFAAEDVLDAEEEIQRMQERVDKQVSRVEMQKLTVNGRRKFNIEGNDEDS